jgi:hypothetical protein
VNGVGILWQGHRRDTSLARSGAGVEKSNSMNTWLLLQTMEDVIGQIYDHSRDNLRLPKTHRCYVMAARPGTVTHLGTCLIVASYKENPRVQLQAGQSATVYADFPDRRSRRWSRLFPIKTKAALQKQPNKGLAAPSGSAGIEHSGEVVDNVQPFGDAHPYSFGVRRLSSIKDKSGAAKATKQRACGWTGRLARTHKTLCANTGSPVSALTVGFGHPGP